MATAVDPAVVENNSTTITQANAPAAGAPDWRASLPEDLRGEESIKSFKDIPALAKSFIETKKMMGSAIRVPGADAKPEEWDSLFAKLGRPESPDKYEFKRPQLPENVTYDDKLETAFKKMAYEAGLAPRQAQKILEGYNQMQTETMTGYVKTMEDGVTKLRGEWAEKWDNNVELASRAVKDYGKAISPSNPDELKDFLDISKLGNHPLVIRLFAHLGKGIPDPPFVTGQTSDDQSSIDSIKLKIDEIRNDRQHPFNNQSASHDARDAANRQMSELYKRLYPEE